MTSNCFRYSVYVTGLLVAGVGLANQATSAVELSITSAANRPTKGDSVSRDVKSKMSSVSPSKRSSLAPLALLGPATAESTENGGGGCGGGSVGTGPYVEEITS